MAEIDTTRTWAPGDTVDHTKLNEIIDQAVTEPAMISGKTVATPVPSADYVMFWDATGPTLKKCLISALQASTSITDVDSAASPAFINLVTTTPGTGERLITLSFDNVNTNKVLAAPADGSLGAPSFRVLSPADLPNTATDIPAYAINCELGNVFKKTLPDNVDRTFTFTAGSGTPGQRIMVYVQQHSATGSAEVHWVAGSGTIQWPGGTEPVMTTGASRRDIFEFICLSANSYFGIRWGANFLT